MGDNGVGDSDVGQDDRKHEELRSQLNDFVDESLDRELRRQVAEHLRDCADCRQEVADLRELLAAGATLPTELEPQRDLWPGIARRIGAADTGGDAELSRTEARQRSAAAGSANAIFSPANLAAAAVFALVLIGAAAIWRSGQPVVGTSSGGKGDLASTDSRPATGMMTSDAAAARTLLALEAETRSVPHAAVAFVPTIAETGDRGDRGLGEGALTALGRDLAMVDRAITELQSAWLADPDNGDIGRRLAVAYRIRARLQGRADRLHATL